MGLGHKLKKAGKHTARMLKYGMEEGYLSHEERAERIAEIRSDDTMSEKEKRERIRAIQEAGIVKKSFHSD